MKKPTIRIKTGSGINEFIDREMTDEEFAQYEIDQAKLLTEKAEEEAKATQRQAVLDRLGLTAEEAKLLLG